MYTRCVFVGILGGVVLTGIAAAVITRHVGEGQAYSNIQDAIDDSSNGDIVIVHPGTYYEAICYKGKNIVITSTNPYDPDIVAATIIDANASPAEPNSTVSFYGNESRDTNDCALKGLTITGGWAGAKDGVENPNCWHYEWYIENYGGGVNAHCNPNISSYAEADIVNCVIEGNHAQIHGGGIYGIQGDITGCIVKNNSAGHLWWNEGWTPVGSGGGIAAHSPAEYGGGVIQNCVIRENTSRWAGGGLFECYDVVDCNVIENTIYKTILSGDVYWETHGGGAYGGTFTDCLIEGNKALGTSATGGGYCGGVITDSTIINNISEGDGGGVCGGTITNCLIESNYAGKNGGGVFAVLCKNSKIYNNSAEIAGGGVFCPGASVTYCHIKGNNAYWGGGACDNVTGENGIGVGYGGGCSVSLVGCLIEQNTAVLGGGVKLTEYGSIYNCTIVQNDNYGIYVGGYYKPEDPDIFDAARLLCTNTIIWGNCDYNDIIYEIEGDLSDVDNIIEYNCIFKYGDYLPGTIDDANNIIGIYPGFVDPGEGDYHITVCPSVFTPPYYPPIDYGTTNIQVNNYLVDDNCDGKIDSADTSNKDMDGNLRIRDAYGPRCIDMGVYEYDLAYPADPNIPIALDYRHYTLDEKSGQMAYDYGPVNQYNGSLVGGPVWKPDRGVLGGALYFDGDGDYIKITDPNYYGISGAHARTVSVWFKTRSPVWQSGGSMPYNLPLVQWGHNENSGQLWMVYLRPGRTVAVAVAGGGVETNKAYNDGLWHHVVAVLEEGETNSANIKLYIDGQLNAIPLGAPCNINTNTENMPVHIGARCWYNNGVPYTDCYMQGLIDDVRIYQVAWSAEDVNTHYQRTRLAQLRGNTVVYYNCDEGSGTTLNDTSWNDPNNGTIYGATWSTSGAFGKALNFNGTSNYAKIPSYNGVFGSNARSVSVWFKTNTAAWYSGSTLPYNMPLVQWGHDASGELWMVYLRSDRKACVAAYGGGVYSSTALNNNIWHHIVAVFPEGKESSEDILLYVDGQLNSIVVASCAVNTNTADMPVHIGAWWKYNGQTFEKNYFKGLIDEVRIFDQALTEEDVQIIYKEYQN